MGSDTGHALGRPVGKVRRKMLICTVLWGDWYIDALLNHTLPSLLAPNNLPFLAREWDIEYIVITRPAEQPRIDAAPTMRLARQFMTVNVLPGLPAVIDPKTTDVFQFHHAVWNFAYQRAKQERSYVLNLPPDAVFSDGSGKTWAQLLAQGMTSILWMFPRVLDSVMPVLRERYLTPQGAMVAPPRELVALNLEYLHPLSRAYFAESTHFPCHPEMVIWPMGGEGFLLRAFGGEARLFDPNRVELSTHQIVTGKLDGRCTFIDDSDAMYMLSLTPEGHDSTWYRSEARADPGMLGRWWMTFDGTSNDIAASRQIRLHTGTRTASRWRPCERAANLFVSRAMASRAFWRVARLANEADCTWVAHLATMLARSSATCLRLFTRPMPVIVFGPTDDVVCDLAVADLLKPAAGRRLRDLVYSHVTIDPYPNLNLGEKVERAGGVLRLRSLAGRELTVTGRADGRAIISGRLVGPTEHWMGTTRFLSVDGRLDNQSASVLCHPHGVDREPKIESMERETGFEPATLTLAT